MNTKIKYTLNTPGVTDVDGFEASGIACDIKGRGGDKLDLALVFSASPCTGAGVFTKNDLKAAPTLLSQQHLKQEKAFHGIIANSGNANACTGKKGLDDAHAMAQQTAQLLGVETTSVLVASTGKIGQYLPMEKIKPGVIKAVSKKSASSQSGQDAAEAILTSDTCSKSLTATVPWEEKTITLGAMAKGAGMIQPNMATMLAFIVTDAQVEAPTLEGILKEAVEQSFNRISIDGDMSTNDTVFLLANGRSKIDIPSDTNSALYKKFAQAVQYSCTLLAEKIVGDGERITKVVEVIVEGASNDSDAEKAARAVANSLLIKASWYGSKMNWGRIAHALGYALIGVEESKLDIAYFNRSLLPELAEKKTPSPQAIEKIFAFQKGSPTNACQLQLESIVSQKQFGIAINLNNGAGKFRILTNDLSEEYVNFNKSE